MTAPKLRPPTSTPWLATGDASQRGGGGGGGGGGGSSSGGSGGAFDSVVCSMAELPRAPLASRLDALAAAHAPAAARAAAPEQAPAAAATATPSSVVSWLAERHASTLPPSPFSAALGTPTKEEKYSQHKNQMAALRSPSSAAGAAGALVAAIARSPVAAGASGAGAAAGLAAAVARARGGAQTLPRDAAI